MAKWEFYDENDEVEITEHDSEPSFSFYDFKKWLTKEKRQPKNESVLPKNDNKEELKAIFKKKVCDRVEKKINEKLKKRKS